MTHVETFEPMAREVELGCGLISSPGDLVHEVQPEAELVWNSEFLREGKAVQEMLAPDRAVCGVQDCADRARAAGWTYRALGHR